MCLAHCFGLISAVYVNKDVCNRARIDLKVCEVKTIRQDKHCSNLQNYCIYSRISRQFSAGC